MILGFVKTSAFMLELRERHRWIQCLTLSLNTSSAKLHELPVRNCRAFSRNRCFYHFVGPLQCFAIFSARKGLGRTGLRYSWSPLHALKIGVIIRQIYFPLQVCMPCTLHLCNSRAQSLARLACSLLPSFSLPPLD